MSTTPSGRRHTSFSYVYGILHWWPLLDNKERNDIWLSLQRDERVYVLRHLTSWTSARDCVRDVLRQVVQRVEDEEHAALAAALLEWEWWTVEYPLT